MESTTTLETFAALDAPAAAGLLAPCCASTHWQADVVAGRPYAAPEALFAASDAALAALRWSDVLDALSAHPRIGRRATGEDTEARWSRAEQSAATADTQTAERLRALNGEYEDRFGFVFLVCATGKSGQQVLAALTDRLGNTADTEQPVVREELRRIVRLRLARTFGTVTA